MRSKLSISSPILVYHARDAQRATSSAQSGGGDRLYHCRSLFIPQFKTAQRHLAQGVEQLEHEIRRAMKLMRDRVEMSAYHLELLSLDPMIQQRQIKVEFRSGDQLIWGEVDTLVFVEGQTHFVLLPMINQHLFIPELDARDRPLNLEDQVERELQALLRTAREGEGVNELIAEIQTRYKVYIQRLDLTLPAPKSEPLFRAPQRSAHSLLSAHQRFIGSRELEAVAFNLTEELKHKRVSCYQRDELERGVYELIYQPTNRPLALIGPSGSGKTNLLYAIIKRYQREYEESANDLTHFDFDGATGIKRDRRALPKTHVWSLSPQRVLAGMSLVGAWQNRLESILEFLKYDRDERASELRGADHHKDLERQARDRHILYVSQPLALLQVGKSAGSDLTLSHILEPYVKREDFQVIVEATSEVWANVKRLGQGFADLFSLVQMRPLSLSQSLPVLIAHRVDLEERQQARISVEALKRVVSIQQSFMPHRALPGALVQLITDLTSRTEWNNEQGARMIGEAEVIEHFTTNASLNAALFDPRVRLDHDHLREEIHSQLIGQPEATQALIDVVHLIKSGLKPIHRPIATFLFAGPTGVGKTEAAKVLTRYLFGDEERMVRFDMNAYIDGDSATRLIGDLHKPEGLLTSRVRHQPFCVLLLDEIEKAHASVHDLLLQVLGEGRLTDARGQVTYFNNTVIIMTSNVGAREARRSLGFDQNQARHVKARYMNAIESTFRPELVNRINHIIIFSSLSLESAMVITQLLIQRLLDRDGFKRRLVLLTLSEEVARDIATRGFDPELGGRALKRLIERDLALLSAEHMARFRPEGAMIYELSLEGGEVKPFITPLEQLKPTTKPLLEHEQSERSGRGQPSESPRSLEQVVERERAEVKAMIDLLEAHDVTRQTSTPRQFGDPDMDRRGLDLSHLLSDHLSSDAERGVSLSDEETSIAYRDSSEMSLEVSPEVSPEVSLDDDPLMLYQLRDQGMGIYNRLSDVISRIQEGERTLRLIAHPRIPRATKRNSWWGPRDRGASDQSSLTAFMEFLNERDSIDEPPVTSSSDLKVDLARARRFRIQAMRMLEGSAPKALLMIRSMVRGEGELALTHLLCGYLSFLDEVDAPHTLWMSSDSRHRSVAIEIDDYSAWDLLRAEIGVHLSLSTFGLPSPLKVELTRLEGSEDVRQTLLRLSANPILPRPARPQTVLRIYHPERRSSNRLNTSQADGDQGERDSRERSLFSHYAYVAGRTADERVEGDLVLTSSAEGDSADVDLAEIDLEREVIPLTSWDAISPHGVWRSVKSRVMLDLRSDSMFSSASGSDWSLMLHANLNADDGEMTAQEASGVDVGSEVSEMSHSEGEKGAESKS